jgi:hypothetical protein
MYQLFGWAIDVAYELAGFIIGSFLARRRLGHPSSSHL